MIEVGVGIWTMRSTAARPAITSTLYAALQRDAMLAEELGFHSVWLAEHHFWYDGWCPASVTAAAAVLGATTRLHAGTGVHLLPLWELDTARSAIETAMRLSGGRLELGVGLGYRDEEFDGHAISRRTRARRMDRALDEFQQRWQGNDPVPEIMVGGFSEPALQRAGRRGLGIFLPFSLEPDRLRATIEHYREIAVSHGQTPGKVAVLKYAWATDGSASERERARAVIAASACEYSGAWFRLAGRPGFESPELLAKQLRLASDNALIGHPEQIAAGVAWLADVGVDLVVLQLTRDDVVADHRTNMPALADVVLGVAADRREAVG
jgi:alkanesulfonate monooxygenase SsuD/methylene tetrahydromethanopterin reductase-like flavin-dependent oxidoreductase (luciferase family)